MDLISKPETADNAENSVKCSICGNTILIGGENGTDRSMIECDVCRTRQHINPRQVQGRSNEDY